MPPRDFFMHVVDVILFAGVCIGHIAILAYSNNWWFALALPHRLLGVLRILHGLFVIGGLAAFGLGYPLDLSLQAALSSGNALKIAATSYAIFCGLVGLIWLP